MLDGTLFLGCTVVIQRMLSKEALVEYLVACLSWRQFSGIGNASPMYPPEPNPAPREGRIRFAGVSNKCVLAPMHARPGNTFCIFSHLLLPFLVTWEPFTHVLEPAALLTQLVFVSRLWNIGVSAHPLRTWSRHGGNTVKAARPTTAATAGATMDDSAWRDGSFEDEMHKPHRPQGMVSIVASNMASLCAPGWY